MAKVTKTQITINTMTANADKSMEEVVLLIAEANNVTEQIARGAYRWVVNKGLAPGNIGSGRTAKAKTKEISPTKALKDAGIKATKAKKFTGKVKVQNTAKVESQNLSDDAVAKIKAANLKKMKEITAKNKYLPGQMARPYDSEGDGPVRTTADAKKWIREEEKRIDEEQQERDFPLFLNKSAAIALIGD